MAAGSGDSDIRRGEPSGAQFRVNPGIIRGITYDPLLGFCVDKELDGLRGTWKSFELQVLCNPYKKSSKRNYSINIDYVLFEIDIFYGLKFIVMDNDIGFALLLLYSTFFFLLKCIHLGINIKTNLQV